MENEQINKELYKDFLVFDIENEPDDDYMDYINNSIEEINY